MLPIEGLFITPPMGREKRPGLAIITHHGGGWYRVVCCNRAKKCRAGECQHIDSLYVKQNGRRIKPVPYESERKSSGLNPNWCEGCSPEGDGDTIACCGCRSDGRADARPAHEGKEERDTSSSPLKPSHPTEEKA